MALPRVVCSLTETDGRALVDRARGPDCANTPGHATNHTKFIPQSLQKLLFVELENKDGNTRRIQSEWGENRRICFC
jgi:hypothetical protein